MSSSIGCFANRAPNTVFVSHFSRYPSITKRVSVPGRNISWSQCGIGLNIENPRMRYRPSSDFTWMSLMTSSVKIGLRPSTSFWDETSAITSPCSLSSGSLPWVHSLLGIEPPGRSDDVLLLARLEVVVVVEHLAADELLEGGRASEPVD